MELFRLDQGIMREEAMRSPNRGCESRSHAVQRSKYRPGTEYKKGLYPCVEENIICGLLSQILNLDLYCDFVTFKISCSAFRFWAVMRITQQLTLPLLAVTSSLAFLAHGMPHDGSSIDDVLGLHKRDATSNYVVYPKDTTNKDQATAIGNLLKSVVSDPTTISVHDTNKGVFFWGAPLTSANAQKVGADSNVSLCRHLRSL